MTYNIEDLRTTDLLRPDHPRARAAARTIQEIRPDVLLVNEITFDIDGVPGSPPGENSGSNARRFAEDFLSVSQGPGLEPLTYDVFAPATNTGITSGFDLDNDGAVVTEYPSPESSDADGVPPRQTREQRAYGNDSWGFGTYPGQYAMALFVAPDLQIVRDSIRTFRNFLWRDMPGALAPMHSDSVTPWYDYLEWAEMRLSSKNHVDLPIRLPDGTIVHILASHPTPPAFDGPERRNKLRNHDEIRFWVDYVGGEDYFTDDAGEQGGLSSGVPFVIMGDLNADPDEGSTHGNPAAVLLGAPPVNGTYVPQATEEGSLAFPDLDPYDTAEWGLRVDYVLPSMNFEVLDGGVYRPVKAERRASDHFPVWLDVRLRH
jgi:endonuclease/exonuclease/phosphatase family metal-dependent hydrolase